MHFSKKPLLLGFILLLMGQITYAQKAQLWGMCPFGMDAPGNIFSINEDGSSFTREFNFDYVNGATPYSSLILGNDGNFYGTTWAGGDNNLGTIFTISPYDFNCGAAYSFDSTTGCYPNGPIIQASDGKLYGLALGGGLPFGGDTVGIPYDYKGDGVIYSFDITTGTYTDEYNFHYTDGAQPNGGLIQATDGDLYGMTRLGGINDTSLDGSYAGGVLFSFNPVTKIYKVVHEFGDSTGQLPYGSLIQATDGKLYGMTNNGGNTVTNNNGVLFSYNINDSTYTDLFDFHDYDGGEPFGNLVQATDGKLYGMTSEANSGNNLKMGDIFSYNPANGNYDDLYEVSYTDTINGEGAHGSLIQGSDGLFYGMMTYGGYSSFGSSKGCGVIFSFNSTNDSLAVLHKFSIDSDGAWPNGDLVEVSDIITGKVTTSVCPGATIKVPFIVSAQAFFFGDNNFYAELSDSSGSFNSPDTIGTSAGFTSDTIIATIPANSIPGNNYLIRVVSSKPALIGLTDKLSIQIGNPTGNFTLLQQITVAPYDSAIFMNQNVLPDYSYKWLFGDSTGDSTNATIVNHTYKSPGTYTVSLIVYNNNGGCSDTITEPGDVVFLPTGLNQLLVNDNQLTLFPNPTSGAFTVSSSMPIDELKVTNMMGQLIYEEQPQQTQFTFQLNEAGLYFVTATCNNQTTTKKLVVTK